MLWRLGASVMHRPVCSALAFRFVVDRGDGLHGLRGRVGVPVRGKCVTVGDDRHLDRTLQYEWSRRGRGPLSPLKGDNAV